MIGNSPRYIRDINEFAKRAVSAETAGIKSAMSMHMANM